MTSVQSHEILTKERVNVEYILGVVGACITV